MIECENCGSDLNVDPVAQPEIDWIKIVCSECGTVREFSMVRLSANEHRK